MSHDDKVITVLFFFFSSRRRHTRFDCDWSSDVCSSDLCTEVEHGLYATDDDLHFLAEHGTYFDPQAGLDRKSTRLNSSHSQISYAVFCLKKKKIKPQTINIRLESGTCRLN